MKYFYFIFQIAGTNIIFAFERPVLLAVSFERPVLLAVSFERPVLLAVSFERPVLLAVSFQYIHSPSVLLSLGFTGTE